MPFSPGALFATAARDKMFSRFDYETEDELAEVLASGYFRSAFYRLRVGDRIDVMARHGETRVIRETVVEALEHPDVVLRPIQPATERLDGLELRLVALEAVVAKLLPPEKKAA